MVQIREREVHSKPIDRGRRGKEGNKERKRETCMREREASGQPPLFPFSLEVWLPSVVSCILKEGDRERESSLSFFTSADQEKAPGLPSCLTYGGLRGDSFYYIIMPIQRERTRRPTGLRNPQEAGLPWIVLSLSFKTFLFCLLPC